MTGFRKSFACLHLEALEERVALASARVIPLSQQSDGVTTFHRLQDAVKVAIVSGDVITVSPGSTADRGPVIVANNNITITGDPNVSGSILPAYNIQLNASGVTLTRLNLGTVTIGPDVSNNAITRSLVNTINVTGGFFGAGNSSIDQNTISGSVSLIGMAGAPMLNWRITNNTFNSFVPASESPLLHVQDATNTLIQNNKIIGDGPLSQVGIVVTRGLNNVIANNTINLRGGDLNTQGLVVQNPGFDPLTTATVRNNVLETNRGRGLYLNAFTDAGLHVRVEGNDFHNNAIGVEYLGSNGPGIASDFGGGSNSQGSSLGGNNFRGFPRLGANDNAAIVVRNAGAGAVLTARLNIFDDPADSFNSVVTTRTAATATAVLANDHIDVRQALSTPRAFVQTLYHNMLGRTGNIAELDGWVSILNAGGANGQSNVVNGILRSGESLGRIVDRMYLRYLGRASDLGGRLYWVSQINAGMTLEEVQAGFIASPEFLTSNNSDYVQGLYRNFFGRTGTGAEIAYWYGRLPELGLVGLAKEFSNSQENRNALIVSLFDEFLHRDPSTGDMAYWFVQPGDLLTVEAALLSSGEYYVRG